MKRNSEECRSCGTLGFGTSCKLVAMLAEIVAGVQSVCPRLIAIPNLHANHILLAATLCLGKVYSPQYVLWLVPLAVIALRERSQLFAFWIWQAGEVIYHVAIWQHLALVSGSHFGLPAVGYALVSLLRIATSIYLITVLVRYALRNPSPQAQISRSRLADFLFGAISSYP